MVIKFTPEESAQIKVNALAGMTQTEISRRMGRSRTSVRDHGIQVLGLNWAELAVSFGAPAPVPEKPKEFLMPPQMVIKPRTKKALIDNLPYVTCVYGDVHYPFEDPAAVEVLYRVLDMVEVDQVICHGDLVDNWQISDFLPPDERKLSVVQKDLGAQFAMASKHLGQVTQLTPGAERVFLEGNHEDRWTRLLRKAQTDYKWRHVLSLPQLQEVFDSAWLLGLGSAGWKAPQKKEILLHDHIIALHGTRTIKWVTRAMLEQYGKSCIFGHTHRIQQWTKTDLRATDGAWNIGCLCDLDPHYGDSSAVDWAQGFALIIWSEDRDFFDVVQLHIHDGYCVTPWGVVKS